MLVKAISNNGQLKLNVTKRLAKAKSNTMLTKTSKRLDGKLKVAKVGEQQQKFTSTVMNTN